MSRAPITLSTGIAPSCQRCGKPKADHTALAKKCPLGRKHQTLGYTQFHATSTYFPRVPLSDRPKDSERENGE